ncbi:MAG: hypothetical protein K2N30_00450 [Clostridia bacterium]|nr:hypothetical protein [Clostridia bacterium]
MKNSALYGFISEKLIYNLTKKIEETDDGLIKQSYIADKEKLEAMLDDAEKEQLKNFIYSMRMWFEYLYYQTDIDVLNMGVKIGMELQEAFEKFKNQEII